MNQLSPWQVSEQNRQSEKLADWLECSDDLNRLLSAAVVNRSFCRKLLAAPADAVAEGYNGYRFVLTKREMDVLDAIRAQTIADFAQELFRRLGQKEVSAKPHLISAKAQVRYH